MKKEKPSLALESTIGGKDVRLFVLVMLNRQKDKKTQKDNKKRQQKKTKKDILFVFFVLFCCLFLSFFDVFFVSIRYPPPLSGWTVSMSKTARVEK